MDKFLLELVERIADSQFSGVWLLLCNGDAGYRLMFGGAPGGVLDEVQTMTDCWHPTPDEAAKAAIAAELPSLFKADDTDGQACMCRECAAKSDDVAVRLRESARRIGEVVPYLVGNEIALNNCLGVDGHKLTLGLVITLLNKSRDTLQSLALTLQGDC